MKIYKLLIPILCGLFISTAAGDLRAQDSCLYIKPDLYEGGTVIILNPDSVAVDTCQTSATANRWYSKRYEVFFKVNAFHLGYGAPDSVIIVHWMGIDRRCRLGHPRRRGL